MTNPARYARGRLSYPLSLRERVGVREDYERLSCTKLVVQASKPALFPFSLHHP